MAGGTSRSADECRARGPAQSRVQVGAPHQCRRRRSLRCDRRPHSEWSRPRARCRAIAELAHPPRLSIVARSFSLCSAARFVDASWWGAFGWRRPSLMTNIRGRPAPLTTAPVTGLPTRGASFILERVSPVAISSKVSWPSMVGSNRLTRPARFDCFAHDGSGQPCATHDPGHHRRAERVRCTG